MNYMRLTHVFTCLFLAIGYFNATAMGFGFNNEGFSDEELEMIRLIESLPEGELQQLARDIDDFVQSELNPDEQAAFYDQVDQYQHDIEERIIGEKPRPEPYKPNPVIEPQETEEQKKENKEIKLKAQQLAKMAERIAQGIQALLITTGSILDFQTDVQEWAEDQEIQPWKPGLTWEVFKLKLEQLIQQLLKTSMFSSELKKYAYMELAVNDQALETILNQLDGQLSHIIPKLGTSKNFSREKNELIKQAISGTAQAILIQELDEKLREIIEKFAPETERITQKKQEQEQKAAQFTQIPTFPRPTAIVGQPVIDEPIIITPEYTPPGAHRPAPLPSTTKPKAPSVTKDKDTKGKQKADKGVKSEEKGGKPTEKKKDDKKKDDANKLKDDANKLKDELADKHLSSFESAMTHLPGVLDKLDYGQIFEKSTDGTPEAVAASQGDLSTLKTDSVRIASSIVTANAGLASLEARLKALPAEQQGFYSKKIDSQLKGVSDVIKKFSKKITQLEGQSVTAKNAVMQYTFFAKEVPESLLSQDIKNTLNAHRQNVPKIIKDLKKVEKRAAKLAKS